MKKLLGILLSVLLVSTFFVPSLGATYQPGFAVTAKSVFMVNLDSNMVMYEKDKDTTVHPGSLAQLMTVIIALESGQDLDNTLISMKSYTQDEIYIKNKELGGVALCGLLRGEEISLRNLLYAISLPGANEASLMIADYIGDGSADYFVQLMNLKAEAIGCTNTKFLSPTGLPDDSYTTAYDMYLIARYAMEIPELVEMANTTFYNGGPTNKHDTLNWQNACRMIVKTSPSYLSYLQNIKTSSSVYTGSSAISVATKGGYRYMLVALGCPTTDANGEKLPDNLAYETTKQLYSWAFDTFKVKTLLEKGKSFGEIPLKLCWDKDFVRLMAKDNFTALIPDEIESSSITFKTVLPDYIKAPIQKGDPVGYVELLLAGERVGVVELVSADSVDASQVLGLFDQLMMVAKTYAFKFVILLIVALIIVYIILVAMHNSGKKHYRR